MGAERPDSDTRNSGANGGNEPASGLWWSILAFAAGGAGFVLLGRELFLARDLPMSIYLHSLPGVGIAFLFAVGLGRPETFRQGAIVAAVGTAAGVLAALCLLPVTAFFQGLELSSHGFAVRLLGIVFSAGLAAFCALVIYRRLGVPWGWSSPAKAESDNHD